MVDNCRHVNRITPSSDHSILNPQKWHCCECETTESVWACLSCSHVACGRYIDEHAVKHYEKTKHPLALEVNDRYCYCYECGDYILNDNAAGDLKILRSALSAVTSQSFQEALGGITPSRSRRILRSQSLSSLGSRNQRQLQAQDRNQTVLWFRRYYLLAKAFTSWKQETPSIVKRQEEEEKRQRLEQEKEEKRLIKKQDALRKKQQKSSRKSDPSGKRKSAGSTKNASGSSKKQQKGDHLAPIRSDSQTKRKKAIVAGVIGLRNLGNTCYMNSILQVLSNLRPFRQYFLQDGSTNVSPAVTPPSTSPRKSSRVRSSPKPTPNQYSGKLLSRQTTQECFQHITESGRKRPGLNGGNGAAKSAKKLKLDVTESKEDIYSSLSAELHALLRVMWSGKWALVSPHQMLNAVWQSIPFFKGYSQQDAQEFLCEFLDKLSRELPSHEASTSMCPRPMSPVTSQSSIVTTCENNNNLITHLFHGQLVSQVTCRKCGNRSRTYEPFTDLSLEFPDRYQYRGRDLPVSNESCHLTEMLAKFTDIEHLEGDIYMCEQCNRRRRKSCDKPAILTQVSKQLLLQSLPPVIRLHLKRFMWCGRNHRGKITAHVDFEEELDIRPYCDTEPHTDSDKDTNTSRRQQNTPSHSKHSTGSSEPNTHAHNGPNIQPHSYTYSLSAVVMHHGRGFGSGHYTAYCWNDEADSWVHCNDAKLQLVQLSDVMKAQAYIVFYTRKDTLNAPNKSGANKDLASLVNSAMTSENIEDKSLNSASSCKSQQESKFSENTVSSDDARQSALFSTPSDSKTSDTADAKLAKDQTLHFGPSQSLVNESSELKNASMTKNLPLSTPLAEQSTQQVKPARSPSTPSGRFSKGTGRQRSLSHTIHNLTKDSSSSGSEQIQGTSSDLGPYESPTLGQQLAQGRITKHPSTTSNHSKCPISALKLADQTLDKCAQNAQGPAHKLPGTSNASNIPSPTSPTNASLQSGSSQSDAASFTELCDEEISFNHGNSKLPKFLELKRKFGNVDGKVTLKRRRTNTL